MLGDLPALDKKKKRKKKKKSTKKELDAFMSLELRCRSSSCMRRTRRPARGNGDWGTSTTARRSVHLLLARTWRTGGVPAALRCCINGHLMRDPVFSSKFPLTCKVSYERDTIELWLKTRGSVCLPLVGIFVIGDLEPDTQLRLHIVRFQVQRTMAAADPFDALKNEDKAGAATTTCATLSLVGPRCRGAAPRAVLSRCSRAGVGWGRHRGRVAGAGALWPPNEAAIRFPRLDIRAATRAHLLGACVAEVHYPHGQAFLFVRRG